MKLCADTVERSEAMIKDYRFARDIKVFSMFDSVDRYEDRVIHVRSPL